MRHVRKVVFWCHLVAGVCAGVVIFTMSVTGVLLMYEKQVRAWADTRGYDAGPPAPGARRLSPEALVAAARDGAGLAPVSITIQSDPDAPAAVSAAGGRTLFLNAYTGAALGEGSAGVRGFFRTVTDVHRWLAAPGESRATGRLVTGVSNLVFLFIVSSGFYLWWPKSWTRARLRNVAWFRGGLSGKARDFNWHNVIGLWLFLPLFVVVLSGVVISFPWAGNLVYRAAGEEPPQQQRPPAPPADAAAAPAPSAEGLDRVWPRAEAQVPGWKSITAPLPAAPDAPFAFSIDSGTGGQPQKRAQLTLDRATGETVKWEPFSAGSPGRRARVILRFAHTGEVLGLAGQTLAGIASAGGALLVWTGLSLAWRRFRAWRARRRATSPAPLPAGADAD